MKLKERYILKKIAGETVAIYCENNIADFRRAIMLTNSAKIMFESLLEETSRAELVALLSQNYHISEQQAENDVDLFLKLLNDNNLLDG